eukprot:499840-Rhodomonas_salina.1
MANLKALPRLVSSISSSLARNTAKGHQCLHVRTSVQFSGFHSVQKPGRVLARCGGSSEAPRWIAAGALCQGDPAARGGRGTLDEKHGRHHIEKLACHAWQQTATGASGDAAPRVADAGEWETLPRGFLAGRGAILFRGVAASRPGLSPAPRRVAIARTLSKFHSAMHGTEKGYAAARIRGVGGADWRAHHVLLVPGQVRAVPLCVCVSACLACRVCRCVSTCVRVVRLSPLLRNPLPLFHSSHVQFQSCDASLKDCTWRSGCDTTDS